MGNKGFHFGAASLIGLVIGGAALSSGASAPRADVREQPSAHVDQSLLRAAQSSKADFLRDLETLVNMDSTSGDDAGLGQVSEFLAQRLTNLGAAVEILPTAPVPVKTADGKTVPGKPVAGKIVRGTFQGTGGKKILLMVHFDTAFPKGEAARRPFKMEGGKAFGPGVADAKGGAAIILHALEIARGRGFKDYKTLTILFNPDEEKSSPGSQDMIRTLSAQQDVVLSYEPPNEERVIVATKGIAYVHLNVKGMSAHASMPEKGRNAAVELAGQIMQLRNLGNPAKGTTVSWTVLQSGDRLSEPPVNTIPANASATADMRFSDLSEFPRVENDAKRIIRKRFVPDTEVAVWVEHRRPPFLRNPQSDQLATLAQSVYRELGKSLKPVAMPYGTDAGHAYHPGSAKPAVLEGLGIVGDGLHTPEEWADLDSVVPRLYLTVRMLETLAGTDVP